jgi:hypothetical protein
VHPDNAPGSCCDIGKAICDAKTDPFDGTFPLFSRSDSVWRPPVLTYKNFTERDAFRVVRWTKSSNIVTRAKSDIRRYVPEMLPNMEQKTGFMCSCQRELL